MDEYDDDMEQYKEDYLETMDNLASTLTEDEHRELVDVLRDKTVNVRHSDSGVDDAKRNYDTAMQIIGRRSVKSGDPAVDSYLDYHRRHPIRSTRQRQQLEKEGINPDMEYSDEEIQEFKRRAHEEGKNKMSLMK